MYMLARQRLEKSGVPERHLSSSAIDKDIVDGFGQLPPKPASVVQVFVQPKNLYS